MSAYPGTTHRLAQFLALSLLLHVLTLAVVLSPHPYNPATPIGDRELHVRMLNAKQHQRPAPAAHPQALVSDTAGPRTVDARANGDVLPGDTATHNNAVTTTALENYLIGRLQTELSRHLVYPRIAREHGWQGTALISVVLSPDGALLSLRLVHSSGHAALDEASLTGLRKLRTLTLAGERRHTQPVEVMLPIRFRLIDNS